MQFTDAGPKMQQQHIWAYAAEGLSGFLPTRQKATHMLSFS